MEFGEGLPNEDDLKKRVKEYTFWTTAGIEVGNIVFTDGKMRFSSSFIKYQNGYDNSTKTQTPAKYVQQEYIDYQPEPID